MLGVVRGLLSGSSLLPNTGASATSSMLRSADQLFVVLSLASDLLPPLPDAATVIQDGLPTLPAKATTANDDRAKALKEDPALMESFCSQLLPLLLQLFSTTVMPQARHKCVGLMLRILAVAPPAQLNEALKDVAISSFVASLLATRDAITAAYGMHMAEVLMEKLPEVMRTYFIKEGVVHGVEQLCAQAPAPASAAPAPGPASGAAAAAAPVNGAPAAGAGTSGSGPQVGATRGRFEGLCGHGALEGGICWPGLHVVYVFASQQWQCLLRIFCVSCLCSQFTRGHQCFARDHTVVCFLSGLPSLPYCDTAHLGHGSIEENITPALVSLLHPQSPVPPPDCEMP